jgi:hypothetical protein
MVWFSYFRRAATMADSPTPDAAPPTSKPRRFVPLVWAAGAVAAGLLGLAVTGTISGFTGSITNSANTSGSGTLLMQESNTGGTVTCYSNGSAANSTIGSSNSNTCSTLNNLGGDQTNGLNLAPGATGTVTTVKIKNAGTVDAAQFTLTPGSCTQSANSGNAGVIANGSATDFCTKVDVTIKQNGTTVFLGTAAQLASGSGATTPLPANLGAVSAGTTVSLEFDVSLNSSAGNTYQGLALSLPLTWQFTQ